MFLKSAFEKLTKQEHLSSHLCWPAEFSCFGKNPSKPHTQMSRINAYVLKVKEGTTRFGWFHHLV